MAATEAAKQAIWLQELLSEVVGDGCKRVVIRVDNKSVIALTKSPIFMVEANTFTGGFTSYESALKTIKLRWNTSR